MNKIHSISFAGLNLKADTFDWKTGRRCMFVCFPKTAQWIDVSYVHDQMYKALSIPKEYMDNGDK